MLRAPSQQPTEQWNRDLLSNGNQCGHYQSTQLLYCAYLQLKHPRVTNGVRDHTRYNVELILLSLNFEREVMNCSQRLFSFSSSAEDFFLKIEISDKVPSNEGALTCICARGLLVNVTVSRSCKIKPCLSSLNSAWVFPDQHSLKFKWHTDRVAPTPRALSKLMMLK